MFVRLSASIVALLLALACSPGDGSVPEPAPQGDAPSEQAGTSRSADAGDGASVTVQADAQVNGTCRPKPREGKRGQELVADVEVVNTGDLGVKVRIAAKWPQLKGQGVIRWKRVNVEQGDTRALTLRLAVAPAEADSVRQAADEGRMCALTHRVIGAYGD
jgi:hypothetical protein